MLNFQNQTTKLQIDILRHAYSSIEYWDANWLLINIKIIEQNSLVFDKNEICLQTTELNALQNWLLTLQKNPDLESQIEFIEPCLGLVAVMVIFKSN